MTGVIWHLWSDEGGATIVEHAILVCVVALVVVSLVGSGLSPKVLLQSVAYLTDSVGTGGEQAGTAIADPTAVGK